ncbi:flavin reductase family protein [Luteococcus japonicus]|uniref:Nitrilotriacetate monooxygenase component B n=1 Tax=Luteococcus japonicus LSP_Lj1 TaxID=1255658 RepID=A0A1R4J0H4_9ACTN|nr:flavin reductase family protein [Luteococcus japonicus]SJN25519.1 Nitrilotriacetate monooxygenase component B [Luteococcus japonicus LSP_Lj1]
MSSHFYRPGQGHGLPHDPFNAIVGPRPIGWIATVDAAGARNLAPYSFFNAFNYTPPIIGFASIGWKDTVANCAATGEFTWNLVDRGLLEQMNQTCAPTDEDEFERAGLEAAASVEVAAPRVAAAGVNFECRVTQQLELADVQGDGVGTWVTFGEVVAVHIREDLLADGIFDTAAAQPMLRAGGPSAYYGIEASSRVDLARPRA